jgi:error-prone DNA polymerase
MGFYTPNSLVQDAQHHGVVVLPPDVNASSFDCTIESVDSPSDDIARYLEGTWRRGRGPFDDPVRPAVALRIGLRYVRNLGEAEIVRIEAARMLGGTFTGPEDLAGRTGLPLDAYEGLAASGALVRVGLDRRDGMWAAGGLTELGPDRLSLPPGEDVPPLPVMVEVDQVRADLWSTGISTTHPVTLAREALDAHGCVPIAGILAGHRHGTRARVGGIVTHRQRPSTARGVRFLNLEDETGLLNVVVLPQVWEANYEVARKAVGVVIDGVVEHVDGVTNFVAHRFERWSIDGVRSRDFR